MKLAIVYDPECPKLTPDAYSQTYRDMFLSLCDRYEEVQEITQSCSAADIEADHIIFFDPHSSHHIQIDGVADHKAVKFEYFNDPHQRDQEGQYRNGPSFKKLGRQARCERANARGVRYAICPYEGGFYKYLARYFQGELLWFPVAPRPRIERPSLLVTRDQNVLANGHCWKGEPGFRPYAFRTWAYSQDGVTREKHAILGDTPQGHDYQRFLAEYVAALALCDTYVVPKYLEIPMAGCVCIAQYQYEYEKMGFQDGHHCLYVTKRNFKDVITDVTKNPQSYQHIASNGFQLATNHWTAKHFAEAVYGRH